MTRPRALVPFDGYQDALEWAFNSQISVPDVGAADAALAGLVGDARFPPGCYSQWHVFSGARVPIRFPHVFKKGGGRAPRCFPSPSTGKTRLPARSRGCTRSCR